MAKKSKSQQPSRRAFVKKAAYVAPAILSLAATPSYATVGSFKSATVAVKSTPPSKDK